HPPAAVEPDDGALRFVWFVDARGDGHVAGRDPDVANGGNGGTRADESNGAGRLGARGCGLEFVELGAARVRLVDERLHLRMQWAPDGFVSHAQSMVPFG